MTFNEYNFEPQIKRGLEELKFYNPTPIQEKAIPLILDGQDIIGCAETGSGKTGAFALPFLSKLINDRKATLLVLTPTRELAYQVGDFLKLLTRFENSVSVATLVGGVDYKKQFKALKRNPRIVVGTPGRVTDHLKRESLSLENTKYLILDEGDRMLDMGFAPQLDAILKFLPNERQTCLFTATLASKVKKLAQKYLVNPVHIQIGKVSRPVESIFQQVIEVDEKKKNDLILDQLNQRQGSIIIFLKTKRRTNSLYEYLKEFAFKVDHIHGDRSQSQRSTALKRFRKGHSRILCATDVAARGLDIPEVEHVINFDLPVMKEDYLHRIGRTARNGAKGEAVSFVAPRERHEWMSLVKKFNIVGGELARPLKSKIRRGKSRTEKEEGVFLKEVEEEYSKKKRPRNRTKKFTRRTKSESGEKSSSNEQRSDKGSKTRFKKKTNSKSNKKFGSKKFSKNSKKKKTAAKPNSRPTSGSNSKKKKKMNW